LFYKLFFSFKIDGAINFLIWQVAWGGSVIFPCTKNTRLLNFFWKELNLGCQDGYPARNLLDNPEYHHNDEKD